MANLDVASLVGTWVAAIVALVALIGIIGPVLVWRASRTQRHQALARVGRNNNGFLSRGIRAGPGIYLLVQVNAPQFKNAPFLNHDFSIDAAKLRYADSPSSWVNFASLLAAYNIHCERGNYLVIQGATTLLPVHRLWILGLGLVGRYGLRKGYEEVRIERTVISAPRRGSISDDGGNILRDTHENVFDGLTGSIRVLDRTAQSGETLGGVLIFEPRPIDEISKLCPDVLPLKCLFMLAFGCIPIFGTRQCRQYLSLVRESEDADDESNSDSEEDYYNKRPIPIPELREIKPRERYGQETRVVYREASETSGNPTTYHIIQDMDRDHGRSEIFRTFRAVDDEIFKLAKFRPKPKMLAELAGYSFSTYVPSESQWIRTPPGSREEYSHGWRTDSDISKYILRADAQAMACSLLWLIWNPEGYLFPTKKFGLGARLLTNVSHRLCPMMSRLIDGINSLDISDSEQKPLLNCLSSLHRNLQKHRIQPTRKYWKRLVALDAELESLGQRDGHRIAEFIIGVLMITNEEFQNLLYQSLRHLQGAASSTITVNLAAATITIPSAFGVLQTFHIDLDRIDPGGVRNSEAFTVTYTAVVLAAMKACLRITPVIPPSLIPRMAKVVSTTARFKLVFYAPESALTACKTAIFAAGAGRYPGPGNYTEVCWTAMGTGQFRPGDTAKPHIGSMGVLEEVKEARVETLCVGQDVARNAVEALRRAHPYEEPAYEVYRMEDF